MKKTVFAILLTVLIFSPIFVSAGVAIDCAQYCSDPVAFSQPVGQFCVCNPINAPDFETLVDKILNFIFTIAIVLLPLMILVAGFLYMSSAGDPEKTEKAKKILLYAIIGLFVLLLAKAFVYVVTSLLGG